jgi:hypothetical protein
MAGAPACHAFRSRSRARIFSRLSLKDVSSIVCAHMDPAVALRNRAQPGGRPRRYAGSIFDRLACFMPRLFFCLILCQGCVLAADAWAVSAFESMGLYYNRVQANGGCRVKYRVAGSSEWREGHPLVYDAREKQYRGSLVGLAPNVRYDIRLEAGGDSAEFQQKTLSEQFSVGKTTNLTANRRPARGDSRRRKRSGLASGATGSGNEVRQRRV